MSIIYSDLFFFVDFFVIGELEECLNFVLGEEVTVRLEFLWDALNVILGHFDEFETISVNDITSDVLLKKSDDIKTFGVLLDWSNEKLVAVALVVEEDFWFSGDFILSEFVPGNIVFGVSELILEANSVFTSLGPQFLVKVHDLSEFFDGSWWLVW